MDGEAVTPYHEREAYMPKAKRTDWQTPPRLFDALAAEYGPFDLDPCGDATAYASQHCRQFWTSLGLDRPWRGRVFVNPPYGTALNDWVYACFREGRLEGGALLVVALLPARTDTRWWHKWIGERCQYADEVRFLKGRVRFVGAPSCATFPSVVVVWRKP